MSFRLRGNAWWNIMVYSVASLLQVIGDLYWSMGMTAIEEILEEASRLSEDARLTLASRILRVDQPAPSEEVERAWDLLIRERIERYDHGETRSRPLSG